MFVSRGSARSVRKVAFFASPIGFLHEPEQLEPTSSIMTIVINTICGGNVTHCLQYVQRDATFGTEEVAFGKYG